MRRKIFLSTLAISLVVLFSTLVAVCIALQIDRNTPPVTALKELALPAAVILVCAVVLSAVLAAKLARDITEPINQISLSHPQKQTVYAELAPLIDRINRQNEQITEQLEHERAELKQQDEMRRDFTANVSHELKTPLTSISGYAELLKSGLVKPEDVARFSQKIYDESGRLITLVGDIIKLSQLDSKEVEVPKEEFDWYETCEAVLSHLEMAAEKKGVTLHLCGEHVKLTAAYQVVEELIFNLCDNAVKYNKEGGRVEVSVRQCVDGVELTVKDTGIGIPEQDLPHIFERFYRVDKSHSKEIGGTGLGLSIVKHGAGYLGASVSVDSVVGEGTTIRVLF